MCEGAFTKISPLVHVRGDSAFMTEIRCPGIFSDNPAPRGRPTRVISSVWINGKRASPAASQTCSCSISTHFVPESVMIQYSAEQRGTYPELPAFIIGSIMAGEMNCGGKNSG